MTVKDVVQFVQMDSWNLTIQEVLLMPPGAAMNATMNAGNVPVYNDSVSLNYTIMDPNPGSGQVLVIDLGANYTLGTELSLQIFYATSPTGQALTWLTPAQTAGKKLPYLYTQCEDINCRTVAPLQDTPSNRITYGGCTVVDQLLVAYMSANKTGIYQAHYGYYKHCFYNSIPIPNYLMAIVVGDLVYQSTGPNTGVITEPENIQTVATCLSDLQQYLNVAEAYVQQPYIWGNYTVVVMPPSFPMGGMENPLLTFASPTIITDDKSQVYVAVHEICHSWTGNTVTMNNWEDFWLNEGFTVFIERHVTAQLYNVGFAMTEALIGNVSLANAISDFGWNNTYSSLHPVLQGDNPDNSFSEVPYEKGFQMLQYIEDSILGYVLMEDFITFYIYNNFLTSIDAFTMRNTFSNYVQSMLETPEAVNEALAMIDFEEWIYGIGWDPTGTLDFSTPDSDAAANLANAYLACNGRAGCVKQSQYEIYNTFYSNLKVVFHDTLETNLSSTNPTMSAAIMT